jgi:hypothetical protein
MFCQCKFVLHCQPIRICYFVTLYNQIQNTHMSVRWRGKKSGLSLDVSVKLVYTDTAYPLNWNQFTKSK